MDVSSETVPRFSGSCIFYLYFFNFLDNRGFMTQNGQPDNPRSARYVLKDYVNGKLLYCVAPPGLTQEEFHQFPERKNLNVLDRILPPRAVRAVKGVRVTTDDLDKAFFQKTVSGAHIRGKLGKTMGLPVKTTPR